MHDLFVGKPKWINQQVIPIVCERIDGNEGAVLLKPLDDFFAAFPDG